MIGRVSQEHSSPEDRQTGRASQLDMADFHSLSPTQADQLSESASSSLLSNTDSDSLRSAPQERKERHTLEVNGRQAERSNQTGKSPILIKYNYYDYNGARQEQTNHDMNYQAGKVQRQLSPTFKQNLDQIVRNSSQQLQLRAKGSPSPPPDYSQQQQQQQQQQVHFAWRYKLSSYEQRCLRCNKTVYQMDKVGPLKDFTFYHQNCFKCRECGTKLTLKTYFNNQQSSGDQEVYCHRHCPKTGPGRLDNQSVGIRAALNAPKVFDASAPIVHVATHELLPGGGGAGQLSPAGRPEGSPNVDSRALYIQHAVQQTRLQNIYKHSQVDKRISQFINRRLEFLEPKQKMLEMRHREEEDALFKAFELKWRQEESCISEQIRQEWQVELSKLLEKYKRQLSSISSGQHQQQVARALPPKECERVKSLMLRQLNDINQKQQQQQPPDLSKQQMIEYERMNLEKTMTIKLDRKKETLKRKLKEFERQATAELVEKQSREMLALISMKLAEYKEEQKRIIGSDLEQFEAIELLADQLGSSLQLASGKQRGSAGPRQVAAAAATQAQTQAPPVPAATHEQWPGRVASAGAAFEAPAPKPPLVSKMELYNSDEPDEVFRDIDQLAINVAREDQQTFTDLVHHLTRYCLTDIEKVRAIFRWITVKNLNTMHFDSSVKPDTPLGLLRGIKNGSESYHVLFKRLCSYAGLHCVVIKGYSKSAGYQPGVKFEGNRFRNSWNAVYVAGAWRFVQCNWGARHLVSVAVMQDKNQPANHNNKASGRSAELAAKPPVAQAINVGRSQQHHKHHRLHSPNHGRRGLVVSANGGGSGAAAGANGSPYAAQLDADLIQDAANRRHPSPKSPPSSSSTSSSSSPSNLSYSASSASLTTSDQKSARQSSRTQQVGTGVKGSTDSLRYEYDDHYFLTDPDEFIYEFFPLSPEWQLIKTRPISLAEFEQLPFVRSLFFKYGLCFPQQDIRSVLYTDPSGATTIKIGMPTHMIPSLIFHYNLKYYDSDLEHHEGVSLKRFVMQSVESGASDGSNGQVLLSNIVSFRVHLPENGAYILDIFANATTPTQYITGEPMKFKSVCKFKIIAKNLKTVMIPLPDCASGEYGPMKATRLFGLIPITHESGLISVKNDKRFLEIQFRMTRPLLDFMASLHKNGYDEKQLSKSIKIFIDDDIVFVTAKFFEDGQYGLDIYTRDQQLGFQTPHQLDEHSHSNGGAIGSGAEIQSDLLHRHKPDLSPTTVQIEPKKQLLTHCCKYLINVRTTNNR